MSVVGKREDTDIPKNVRMYGTELTGNTVIPLALDQSGQITVSLETADTLIAKVSGETLIVKNSGQVLSIASGTIVISQVSGESVSTTVSGNVIIAKVSGETITVASGLNVIPQSGIFVLWASGAAVTTGTSLTLDSGSVVMPEAFAIASGKVSISSGQVTAKVSGEVVSTASGNEIIWRGVTVSGVVKISGETIVSASGVNIIWRGVTVSGSVIVSGTVSVSGNVVTSASGTEIIWRTPIISGSVIVSGNVGISSGIEIIWRPSNESGQSVLAKITSPNDTVEDSVITIDFVHHMIHDGKYFDAFYYQADAGTVSGVVLHLVTPEDKAVHFEALIESDVPGIIEMWEGATVGTSGTIVTVRNHKRDSTTSGTVLAFSQPGYTSGGGTLVQKRFIGVNGNVVKLGGTLRENSERILKSGTNYLIKFVPENTDNNIVIQGEWYEV